MFRFQTGLKTSVTFFFYCWELDWFKLNSIISRHVPVYLVPCTTVAKYIWKIKKLWVLTMHSLPTRGHFETFPLAKHLFGMPQKQQTSWSKQREHKRVNKPASLFRKFEYVLLFLSKKNWYTFSGHHLRATPFKKGCVALKEIEWH